MTSSQHCLDKPFNRDVSLIYWSLSTSGSKIVFVMSDDFLLLFQTSKRAPSGLKRVHRAAVEFPAITCLLCCCYVNTLLPAPHTPTSEQRGRRHTVDSVTMIQNLALPHTHIYTNL